MSAPALSSIPLRAALAALVFGVTAAVFWPAGEFEFLGYDDVVYVTANPRVRAGLSADGVRWALTATDTAANWHPLTWLAHMLDVERFGLDAGAHHRSSVLWHAAAATLVYLALASLLRAPVAAAGGALLFALHPLRVEAVAMVADRKDLVAACCAALNLWAFVRWRRAPGGGAAWLALSLASMALGLAAKPTLLAWPAVLWLVDREPWLPPRSAGARARASAPFALLAALALVPAARFVRAARSRCRPA